MKPGDCFWMSVPPKYDVEHPFYVISDPSAHGGTFIAINLTGDVARAGKECCIKNGEFPGVTKDCYANFADALEVTPAAQIHLQSLVGKLVKMGTPATAPFLKKMVEAAKSSKSIPANLKKYF